MDLLAVIVVSLVILSGLDAHLWPQTRRQVKRQWLRRLARRLDAGKGKGLSVPH